MKRLTALLIGLLLLLTLMTGCSPKTLHLGQGSIVVFASTFENQPELPESSSEEDSSEEGEDGEEEKDPDGEDDKDEGSEESSEESAPAPTFNGGSVAVQVVTASISIDHDKVIKSLKLDKYELNIEVDSNGYLLGDISTDGVKSAKELGYDYGMKASSKLSLEWFEQVENFEKWAVGKTVDQLLAMNTVYIDESRPAVPGEPDLNVSVSISVGDFLKAIKAAAEDAGWTEGNENLNCPESSSEQVDYSSFFEDSSSSSSESASGESYGVSEYYSS